MDNRPEISSATTVGLITALAYEYAEHVIERTKVDEQPLPFSVWVVLQYPKTWRLIESYMSAIDAIVDTGARLNPHGFSEADMR